MTELTTTQRTVLTAAAARPGLEILPLPEQIKGGAAKKVTTALLARGLIRDEGDGGTLVATDAGLRAIGIDPTPAEPSASIAGPTEPRTDTPYRLRMIRAEENPSGAIKLWNHTFREPSRFAGATFNPDLRQSIQATDLISLEQCHYQVLEQQDGYHGSMEPGCQCIVRRDGKDTVLVSSFHLQGEALQTLDRGHDPITNERCWGSVAGPFQFTRIQSWATDMASAWL